ncbi:hypothetical protein PHAVU_010G021500 [Phaseolus vulgaris]|uniref:RALF-like protein n=1 Tax=Phaseolus vulgaris TaxID=3885 RepID=V7AKK6_PHAVU|nr:hypothetical protein PHAVU_010G021500g [Phaseolus vulgaris]ESW06122.1 hypothetical protein PHAVU_010G021500g [Phaseolus vulgaris]
MGEKKCSMKVWFLCFLVLSMVALGHGNVEDEVENTETKGVTERRLSDDKTLSQPVNEYNRGCNAIHRCRGKHHHNT